MSNGRGSDVSWRFLCNRLTTSETEFLARLDWVVERHSREDGDKCVGALQELLELRLTHGPQEQVANHTSLR